MENLLGLLRIHIRRGINLAIRDVRSSDPYVVVRMGKQKLKTRVVKKNINPQWNEDLTLTVSDPNHRIKLSVFDKDTFSKDDKMGDAEFDIKPFIEAVKMVAKEGVILPAAATATGETVIARVKATRENCMAGESCIVRTVDGKVVQDIIIRLRNVERGEVELQLQWIDLPGSRGLMM
ncbi:Protein C2-DOMAIN ABA-RELATED 4 [Sarracenia purpurea var. burkii]